ncbi:uncharacterized protein LOC141735929 isoform X3 [Larus michahellis]|uniref:uncharacterized protein LOC141735929 isoform X3 n=1 Tax=Larus michahellis TaxID=119627 RepID=UPI003D9B66C1
MSHRLLTALALPAGAALAAAAAGSQFLCQASEIPKGEEDSAKEAKVTNTKWGLSHKQKRPARNGKQCDLTGWWENELGSKMHVDAVDSQGNFTGEYHTAVSSAQKPIEPSPLLGSQHLDEDGQCTFGFTVNWKFSGLVTTSSLGRAERTVEKPLASVGVGRPGDPSACTSIRAW